MKLLCLVFSFLAGLAPAQAQGPARLPPLPPVSTAPAFPPVPLAVKVERVVGPWELSTPNGDRQCRLSHASVRARTAMTTQFDAACRADFPVTADVAGWSMTAQGHLQWLDTSGNILLDFSETDTGIYEALRPGDPTVYFLTNLALAGTAVPTPADITGLWSMSRPQTRLTCAVMLDDGVLGGGSSPMEERLVVKPAETCDKTFGGLKLYAWRLERELLVLYASDQQVLTFRRDMDNRWNKVPPDRSPLVLTKP